MKTKMATFSDGSEERVCIHCETPCEGGESACCEGAQVEAAEPLVEAMIRFCDTNRAPAYLIEALEEYQYQV